MNENISVPSSTELTAEDLTAGFGVLPPARRPLPAPPDLPRAPASTSTMNHRVAPRNTDPRATAARAPRPPSSSRHPRLLSHHPKGSTMSVTPNDQSLIAEDIDIESLSDVTSAGFASAGSFACGGSFACPASSFGSASSFSSVGS
jgi:hypothetical protein